MPEPHYTSSWNRVARVAKNSLVLLIAGLLNKGLGVVLVIYSARSLGVAGFGSFSYILSLYAVFYILADFGLGTILTRDLASGEQERHRALPAALTLRGFLALVSSLGMLASLAWMKADFSLLQLGWVAALGFIFNAAAETLAAAFNAEEQMEIPAFFSLAANFFRVVGSLLALAWGAGVAGLLWFFMLSWALQATLMALAARRYFARPWRLHSEVLLRLLREAWPVALASGASTLYFRLDTLMLGAWLGPNQVGIYSAAYRLLEFGLILPAYFNGAIFPVIAASHQEHSARFFFIYQRSLKYLALAIMPLAACGFALAPHWMRLIYGESYLAGAPILRLLMCSLFLTTINSLNAPYLIAMRKQRTVTLLALLLAAVNLGLNCWLIPSQQALGAAWANLLAELLNTSLYMIILWRSLAMDRRAIWQALVPFMAGMVMLATLHWGAAWGLGYQLLAAGAVYTAAIWALRGFDAWDRDLLRRAFNPQAASRSQGHA
jgi:O-antigen/teichoic acid export membrane protein